MRLFVIITIKFFDPKFVDPLYLLKLSLIRNTTRDRKKILLLFFLNKGNYLKKNTHLGFFTFSKKFFYILSVLTIWVFSMELSWMHPYQYTWFNMPSRFFEIGKNFISGAQSVTNLEKTIQSNF